jgi:diguanylate cyclase (GGDEF)-like protein
MVRRSSPTIAALLRFVASRLDVSAVGVFRLNGSGADLWDGTDTFRHHWARRGDGPDLHLSPLPDPLRKAATGRKAARLDPGCLGLACPYAAVMPVRGDTAEPQAFFLILSARNRWLGSGAGSALVDAADILTGLMAANGGIAGATLPQAASTAPRQALPSPLPLAHADALRLIRDMPTDADAGGKALLMLDVDRFRSLNEALGSAAGDYILAGLFERLADAIEPGEKMARLGGDRFLILTRKSGTRLDAFAAHLLARVSVPLSVGEEPVGMQATIGLVVVPQGNSIPAATLFMQADKALRRGKVEGGNRVTVHDPDHDATLQDMSRLELDLGAAIRADQLRLVYQPYVSLLDGSVSGVEALLRWQHPGRGELTPGSFMTLAETSGQILPIGGWVLREALCRAAEWPARTALSVNVSALQFQQPDFTAQIDSALALSGFPAERLEIEITETVLMRDDPETLGQLRTLIARGIRIALDDFGSGYSALSYLARLPHHRIKLDKNFVDDLDNPATSKVIRAIVSSARAQGIAVTAEGIESEARLDLVRKMGFTHAQGYLIGLPVEDPTALLAGQTEGRSRRASA